MKVLMISTDRKLFQENSAVRQRIIEYGKLADELRIIIFSRKELQTTNPEWQINDNVFLYPTNSLNKWLYIFDAYKIGKMIIKSWESGIKDFHHKYIVTSQDPFECGLAGWLLKRKFRASLQLQIHTDVFSSHFVQNSVLNKMRVLLAKFLIPRADCIRVVSMRIKKSLILRLGINDSKIIILPIFVDVRKIKETPIETDLHAKYQQFDFIILMASRLTREKNIGLAIKAMAEVVKKYPKAGLIIVGSGPEGKNLKSQISNLKMNKNIIIEEWFDDVISYYKTVDLFILTSNYEGYGMSVVEAMAANCPVIMTDVGVANEVLIDKKDGIIVPISDQKRLTEAIFNLIENHDLKQSLTANAGKTIAFWPTKEEYLKACRGAWFLCGQSF